MVFYFTMPTGWTIYNDHRERKLAKVSNSVKHECTTSIVDQKNELCKFLSEKYSELEYQSMQVSSQAQEEICESNIPFLEYHQSIKVNSEGAFDVDKYVDIEIQRCKSIDKIRCYFDDMLRKIGIARPRETLNRWIMEWRCHFDMKKVTLDEPLIPSRTDYFSPLLQRELKKQILLRSKGFTDRTAVDLSAKIIQDLTKCCKTFADQLQDTTFPTKKSAIEVEKEFESVKIVHPLVSHEILAGHYEKLRLLYQNLHPDEKDDVNFHKRLIIMLQRYRNATGFRPGEGCGHHCATPPTVLNFLSESISVMMECFASPLNSYFPFYCSMFGDTDVSFGSFGSFFSFFPTEGSFEAGPPYVEEVMEATRAHICYLLRNSDKPLSFTVIIPEWRDYPTECISKMDSNEEGFIKRMISISKHKHVYLDGFQHCTREKKFKPVHDTLVVVMQNEPGSSKWPVDDVFERRLREVWVAETHGISANPLIKE